MTSHWRRWSVRSAPLLTEVCTRRLGRWPVTPLCVLRGQVRKMEVASLACPHACPSSLAFLCCDSHCASLSSWAENFPEHSGQPPGPPRCPVASRDTLLPDARLPGCPLACLVHWAHRCTSPGASLFWDWRVPTFQKPVLGALFFGGAGREKRGTPHDSIVNGILAYEGHGCGVSGGPGALSPAGQCCWGWGLGAGGCGLGRPLSAPPETAGSWRPRLLKVCRVLMAGGCAL